MRLSEIMPDQPFMDDGFDNFLAAQSDDDLIIWATSTEGDLRAAFELEWQIRFDARTLTPWAAEAL